MAGGTIADLQVLVDGLLKSVRGDADAVRALGSSAPNVPRDVPVILVFAIVLFCFNWGARLLIVEPMGRTVFSMKGQMSRKFAQSMMEAAFYGAFTFIGLMIVPSQPWVWPSSEWWRGYLEGAHVAMRTDLRGYYLTYMARYVMMVLSVLIEPKRKDFLEMMLHHVVTVGVIWISYVYGFNRIGVVTMLLLDPADVPLHIAKVCKYTYDNNHIRIWQFLADRCFEFFAFTFFVTRLVLYGYVVWSAFTEGFFFIPEPGWPGNACLALLSTLLVLQGYWFFLIMKVAARLLRGGSAEDVRSDDEAERTPRSPKNGSSSPSRKDGGELWRITYASPVLLLFARQCNVAWSFHGGRAGLESELRLLLGGLRTVMVGGTEAAKVLSASSPDIPRDTAVFVVFTCALFLMNWGWRLVVVEPVARLVLRLSRSQLAKYAQSVMEATVYGGFLIIGARVVLAQEWVWPSAKWWIGFADGGHEIMRADLRCYYILYISRYYQAILSVLLEARRKDFVEMIVHHVVTVTVIYISYVHGWNRVGVVVMVLLDPADVPLHLAKLCKYTAEATKVQFWQFVADRLFEVFAVVFFVTRLIMYGYVCWSCHIEATRYFPKGVPEWTCVGLLYTLLLLQVYWFFLIIKVAVKLLTGGGAADPRSDDEGEDVVVLPSSPGAHISAPTALRVAAAAAAPGAKAAVKKERKKER